jgi:phosphoglycerate kinase
MRYLRDIDVSDKRVLVRADLNVPRNEEGEIADDNRINKFLPTLKYILENGGRPIVMSHLGRPAGKVNPILSLKPVAEKIQELLGIDILFANNCIGPQVEEMARNLDAGQVLLLENLRFHPEEMENDKIFSEKISRLGNVFINDAFATAHRSHSSMVGVPGLFTEKAAGFLMQNEIEYFDRAMINPLEPLCVILGGAKVSTKMKTLLNIANKADKLIIGGAMANTFLAAQGVQMGRSLYEADFFPRIIELMGMLARKGCKVYLPVDFRVGASPQSKGISRVVTSQEVPPESMALDIGPATSLLYSTAITSAETIVWNGPMGTFENEDYSNGTYDLVQALASAHGLTVAGGGDTDAAIYKMELEHKFDYISTGGGAFLALLEGKQLPGFAALE